MPATIAGTPPPFGKFKTSDAERGGVPAPLLPALRRARLARRGPAPLVAAVSRADLSCSALVMSISAGVVTTGMPSATPAGNRASITGAPPVAAGAAAVTGGRCALITLVDDYPAQRLRVIVS